METKTYNSKAPEFATDMAELIALYGRAGFAAASARCSEIADARGLNDAQRLTLADRVRRDIIVH